MHLTQIKKALPDFITQKHDFFIEDRIHSNADRKPIICGMQPKRGDVVMQTNDYLSLNSNESIKNAHIRAIQENDESLLMSGVFLLGNEKKPAFETKLAQLTGFESCVVSQSGWTANVNLLQAICNKDTNVYIDFFAHASLWEGARIAGAKVYPFMHNNTRHLARQIKRNGPGIILVDSIYSTIGTIAPLVDLVSLSYEHECALVVDESHSLGTHGPKGAGLVAELGLTAHVDFITASLAKTFSYRAGAILTNKKTAYCIPMVAYPAIFSSAMLPYEMKRLEATLDVIIKADERRATLQSSAEYLNRALRKIGFDIRSESQIFGLDTGDAQNTLKIRNFFESNGVFGSIFCPPATPNGKHILRFSINAEHTRDELERVINVCKQAWDNPELSFD
ncbi:alpha-hydroxyketone-type quorum-sensing autoinducer synthase [Vibrio methylphosphonaticus]|uniref:alpha-hydroxyketone-type quorum-sensing autoinducer synthase n=1 Tax=Vibrio methylphosphonaticus TaxID=2946866 RepID=UPI002029CE82|nr:alpha-hydroxyketone-type quorum-sensing autoinducer synthase [Vibrio methylphosphonaticus]MCL9773637.1 quorum-sensing autoinducer CAI-1 synthase [Vibrio methylphosphonaticus]